MEPALTVADLARFLRARKSANCKIGADFCEEFPEHPEVERCRG